MKYLTLFILSLSIFGSQAQITITSSDMPNIGDKLRFSISDTLLGIDAQPTGTNYTWDFSFLNWLSQDVDTFLGSTQWSLSYQFAFGPFGNPSSYALKGTAIDSLGSISIDEYLDFFRETSGKYQQTGFGMTLSGLPIPVVFDTNDVIYRFPMNFGNIDSSISSWKLTLPIYYGSLRKRYNEVDGWGSLTTPYGTFDVLRIKSDIFSTDTIGLDSVNGFTVVLPQQIEYKWLGKGQGIPLLTIIAQVIANDTFVTSITYRDSNRIPESAIPELAAESIQVYPNPAHDLVTIVLHPSVNIEQLQLFDIHGKRMKIEPLSSSIIRNGYMLNVSEFRPGIYLLQYTDESLRAYKKLIIY
ncbi:MAG: T9SS type A sorting domain-containing protein [Bacteroidetes bacterium]|nr:T9SS type A sorting domain-containing protein [Bacteroidota bacterium]